MAQPSPNRACQSPLFWKSTVLRHATAVEHTILGGTPEQRGFLGEVILESLRGTLIAESFQGSPLDDVVAMLSRYMLEFRMLDNTRISLPNCLYTSSAEFASLSSDPARYDASQAARVHGLVLKFILGDDFADGSTDRLTGLGFRDQGLGLRA